MKLMTVFFLLLNVKTAWSAVCLRTIGTSYLDFQKSKILQTNCNESLNSFADSLIDRTLMTEYRNLQIEIENSPEQKSMKLGQFNTELGLKFWGPEHNEFASFLPSGNSNKSELQSSTLDFSNFRRQLMQIPLWEDAVIRINGVSPVEGFRQGQQHIDIYSSACAPIHFNSSVSKIAKSEIRCKSWVSVKPDCETIAAVDEAPESSVQFYTENQCWTKSFNQPKDSTGLQLQTDELKPNYRVPTFIGLTVVLILAKALSGKEVSLSFGN